MSVTPMVVSMELMPYPYPPVYSGLKTCTELSEKLFAIQVVDLCALRSGISTIPRNSN